MDQKIEMDAVLYFNYVGKCYDEIAEAAQRLSAAHKQLKELSEHPFRIKSIISAPGVKRYFDNQAAEDTMLIKEKLVEVVEFIATTQPLMIARGD